MGCATFRHLLKNMDLLGFQMPIVDAIPYIHKGGAGKFVLRESILRSPDVLAFFRQRITKMVIRLSESAGAGGTSLTPVLYVCREVFFTIAEWTEIEMTPVTGLEGIVFRAELQGIPLLVIRGKHPSPRGWAGQGKYREYIYFLNVFKACLLNPRDPLAELTKIDEEELIRVAEMQRFFQLKGVALDGLSQLRPSCFHRSTTFSQIGWDAIQKTIANIAPSMTKQLPATDMALLTLQMFELDEIGQAIEQFGVKLSGKVSLLEPSVVFTCMKSIVKHSNALAFRLDSAPEQSITTRVDALIYHITETLHVEEKQIVAVITGITAKVTRENSFERVAYLLTVSGVPFEWWAGILSTGGAINAIAAGALEKVTAALKAAGVPFERWAGILSTNGAINAIAAGALDKVTAALKAAGLPFDKWSRILLQTGQSTPSQQNHWIE